MNSHNRKIKVLHLISGSGDVPYLSAIADRYDRSRFSLTVASLAGEGELHINMRRRGIDTFSLGCTGRMDYPAALLNLFRRLVKERFDIVQTHLFEASIIGLTAACLARTRLAVLTAHHCHEHIFVGRYLPLMIDKICTRVLAHQVIAPSHEMEADFMKHHNLPQAKIAVIPYGFEFSRWRESPEEYARIRSELGLVSKTVIGAVGRLYWIKNFPVIIDAFSRIATANPNVVLLILGDGPDDVSLRRLAAEKIPSGQVVFGGHRPDIIATMSAIDLLVHASQTESFCQVIIEALVLGKPVISTKVGIAEEVIISGVNGYLIPINDADALARAMGKILAERDRWPAMAQAAKDSVLPYAAEQIVPLCEEKYLQWLGCTDMGAATV